MLDNHSFWLAMPRAAWFLFAATAGALAFAFVMQYGFGFLPCVLCLWQRVPFAVAALLSLITIFARPYTQRTRVLLMIIATVLMLNAGLAVFHTGVERHWWLGTSGCSITPLHGSTPKSLREELLSTPVAHCDEISWSFLGLSMTNYNVAYSFALSVFAALASRRKKFIFI